MSWIDWDPPAAAPSSQAKSAVSVSAAKPGGRYGRALRITIRADLMTDAPAFLAAGARVRVQIGQGENAGVLRLVPGRPSDPALGRTAGRSTSLRLALSGWAWLPPVQKGLTAAEFDFADDWLQVTLPAWARPVAAAAAAAPAPALAARAAATEKKPFVGAATGAPASAFAGMRGGR